MKKTIILLGWLLANCFKPDFPSGVIHCGAEEMCPPGQICHAASGLCYRPEDLPPANGATTDAGRDGNDLWNGPQDGATEARGLSAYYLLPDGRAAARLELLHRIAREVPQDWLPVTCSAENSVELSCRPAVPEESVVEIYVRYYARIGGRPRGSCENDQANGLLLVAWWGNPLNGEIFPGDPAQNVDCVHRYQVPSTPRQDGGVLSTPDMGSTTTDAASRATATVELHGGGCQCTPSAQPGNQKSTFPSWAVLGALVTRSRRRRPARKFSHAAGVFLYPLLDF